jgi:hypothetical protein
MCTAVHTVSDTSSPSGSGRRVADAYSRAGRGSLRVADGVRIVATPSCQHDSGDETESGEPEQPEPERLFRDEEAGDEQHGERCVEKRGLFHDYAMA